MPVLVEILAASLLRCWLPSCRDIGCPLMDTFTFLPVLTLRSGFFRFSFAWNTCYDLHRSYSWIVRQFGCLLYFATFLSFSWFFTLEQFLLVMPTLWLEFVSDITVRLCCQHYNQNSLPTLRSYFFNSQKFIVVVLVSCCDLHRSSYLLLPLLFYDV